MAKPMKQNAGSTTKHMNPTHRAGGAAIKPRAGSTAVKLEGTVVKSHGGVGVTKPSSENAGSHDDKVRLHGAD